MNGGFERESVEQLVNYTYTGRLEVPEPMVKAVFIAAKRLKVSRALSPDSFKTNELACVFYRLHFDWQ